MIKNINRVLSDQQILITFVRLYVRSVLNTPATEESVKEEITNKSRANDNNNYLKNRYKVVFYRLTDDGHYMILRFIECAFWLLNDEYLLQLDDDMFGATVKKLEDAIKRDVPLTDDERRILQSFLSLETYSKIENQRVDLKKLENECDVLQTHKSEIGERKGPEIWGPFYWAFIHRFVYRLEDKFVSLKHEEIGSPKSRILSDCFLSFFWFVKFMSDFMLCPICSFHYENSPSRLNMMKSILNEYPGELLLSSPEHVDEKNFQYKKNLFYQRIISVEFYLAHARHSQSLYKTIDYNVQHLFGDLS